MVLFKGKNRKDSFLNAIFCKDIYFEKKVLTVNNKSEKPIVLILRKF